MIIQNGVDVTDAIAGKAKANGLLEKRRTNDYEEAQVFLIKAKSYLCDLPLPWMNDCVYNSIKKIEEILADLKSNP